MQKSDHFDSTADQYPYSDRMGLDDLNEELDEFLNEIRSRFKHGTGKPDELGSDILPTFATKQTFQENWGSYKKGMSRQMMDAFDSADYANISSKDELFKGVKQQINKIREEIESSEQTKPTHRRSGSIRHRGTLPKFSVHRSVVGQLSRRGKNSQAVSKKGYFSSPVRNKELKTRKITCITI